MERSSIERLVKCIKIKAFLNSFYVLLCSVVFHYSTVALLSTVVILGTTLFSSLILRLRVPEEHDLPSIKFIPNNRAAGQLGTMVCENRRKNRRLYQSSR